MRVFALCLTALASACGGGSVDRPRGAATDWPAFGGAPGGGHYSAASEITPQNVHALELAWTHRSGDVRNPPATGAGEINGPPQQTSFEVTPIVVAATLYYCTPFNRVFALDAATGKERWVFDPKVEREKEGTPLCRGVSYWQDGAAQGVCAKRIVMGTLDARLIALDAGTGEPCADFGVAGTVDLSRGLTPYDSKEYDVKSPPAIIGDTVIVGSLVADSLRKGVPAGVVRAFDVRSGEQRWAWNAVPPTMPPQDENGLYVAGTANVWSIISVDAAHNLVFLPTGNAGNDYYGGDRNGLDYYSSSIVALDATSGQVVWHFQAVHHDLWDYDMPSQPTLVDLTIDGQMVPALVEVTKMGLTFVLNRLTGEPVFHVEEKPVPQDGAVSGEQLSPTQPFPSLPVPLGPLSVSPDDAWGFTFWDKGKCRDALAALHTGPIYLPPSLQGSSLAPSTLGGNDWGSPAIDPVGKIMVVATNHIAMSAKLMPRAQCGAVTGLPQTGSPYCAVIAPLVSPWGAPCTKPPWATLDAVDLTTGQRVWSRALGRLGALAPWPLSRMEGGLSMGGPMITQTGLVFAAAGTDFVFRAYDLKTGQELWQAELPTTANSVPMTYRLGDDGPQYVVVAAGGHFLLSGKAPAGDYLMAFALPRNTP